MEAGEDSERCWRIKKLLPQRSGRGVGPSWRPLYLSWRRDRCRERLKKQNQWNCIISSGGYHLLPQIRWLKITAILSPMVLEARSQKARCWQPTTLWAPGASAHASPTFLVCGSISLTPASVVRCCSPCIVHNGTVVTWDKGLYSIIYHRESWMLSNQIAN